jgi:hypothetical protein
MTSPSKPKRVQMSRQRPWREQNPDAVIVARPSRWGNPFPIPDYGTEVAINLFRDMVRGVWNPTRLEIFTDEMVDRAYQARLRWMHRIGGHPSELIRYELAGRDLACWCAVGRPCHADVLLAIANPEVQR